MYKQPLLEEDHRMDGAKSKLRYVETDPSARYGRFREILGKGAMKTVYKAFDEVLGMEVAWNQVKLKDVFHSPEELQRLYSEVHLLSSLKHDSLIRFYTSWIDVYRRTFNFITEFFTSGTLREYRHKHRRVDIRAVKNWARQILHGLVYLHGHDPPVIHRDLKCDNIFINGHLGQVKIGDFGLAAILRGSQHAHSVIGTPEFMAPELYEEDYNELVDVYSFGMCVLEMLTCEYPYSECSNPAQIYKKVVSGKLPEAFYRIQHKEAQQFVKKCLEPVSKRLPSRDLLLEPFLASETEGELLLPLPCFSSASESTTMVKTVPSSISDLTNTTNMTITGTMDLDDDTIFLKVQITDKDGRTRNIYFPFDIVKDTAIGVAMEMVKELEISDWEPSKIARMIEEEIWCLLPSWKQCVSPLQYHKDDVEDEDQVTHQPFYSPSHSSSTSVPTFNEALHSFLGQDSSSYVGDDAASSSSLNSFQYSNISYHEEDYQLSCRGAGEAHCISNCTRLCPSHNLDTSRHSRQPNVMFDSMGNCSSKYPKRLGRIKSMVDVRRQLLHGCVLEEIRKRRLFKTVGAVENIGFQEPREAVPAKTVGSSGDVCGGKQ